MISMLKDTKVFFLLSGMSGDADYYAASHPSPGTRSRQLSLSGIKVSVC